ncbi:hypothetical protein [Marispirochaeta aestuarii]|uniref:hypothetical protein n=1 Tax=Marispirochaeta aestuarii TaxID=1963862 RepID=UPI002ABDF94C|nr:hypothetical protein [Marispirochaeta aestuarii]
MGEPIFTRFHEETITRTTEKLDELTEKVSDIHRIVSNGLREKVTTISEQIENLTDPKKRAETCPVIVSRKKRRKSWEWWLVMSVGFTSILSNLGLTDWIKEAIK